MLRDASSLNGSRVDGLELAAGTETALRSGALLELGSAPGWTLIDAGPPLAVATCARKTVTEREGWLRLSDVVGVFFREEDRAWVLESPEGEKRVHHGDTVDLDGVEWSLQLPARTGPTERAGRLSVRDCRLAFHVSADEETVSVTVFHGERQWALPPRAHHYTMVTMARRRLEDAPGEDAGWWDGEALCRALAIRDNLLYTHLFRARRELSQLGFSDGHRIVERRADQLRIGVADLQVSSAST